MNERQREELLERVYRSSGTVGRSIPETVTLEDESVPLRRVYFEVAGRDELPAEERERVQEVLSYLRRKRLALVQRIEEGGIEYETGTALVDRIRKLDRAINAFESLDDPSFEEQVRRERVESAREAVELLREFGKL